MNLRAKAFVTLICAGGLLSFAAAFTRTSLSQAPVLAGWFFVQLLSGLFWMEMRESNVTTRFGTSLRIAVVCAIGPWATILTAFSELLIEGFFFQNKPWYKTLFNASQVAVCVAVTGLILTVGGFPAEGLLGPGGPDRVVRDGLLEGWRVLWLVAAVLSYGITNAGMMATLIRQLSPLPVADAWKQGASGVPNILETTLNVALFFVLVEVLGVAGIVVFLAIPALEHLTKRRRFQLLNAQEELVRTQRLVAVGEIAEEVATSMQDNLSSLRESTERLENNPEAHGTEKLSKGVRTIRENLGHMRTLIEGLSQFSDQSAKAESVDLNLLTEKTLEFVKPQNRFDNIQVHFTANPEPSLVDVAPGRIQQVLINLLTNAADAINDSETADGHIHITTRREPTNGNVQVVVLDNGPGIPKESMEKIFEPQYTTKPSGHGFGLAAALRIAQDFHGDLKVYNRPGGGAEFCLELPPSQLIPLKRVA